MKKYSLILAGLLAAILMAPVQGSAKSGNNKNDIARNILIFSDVYRNIMTGYVDTLDATSTMRTAIDAMLGQIDPYTEYYSPEEQDLLTSVSSGEYAGIGSVIMKRDTTIVLSAPTWNSPARKAGIRHGDILLAIDDTVIDAPFTTAEASKRLKGQPGTTVTLKVKRPYTPAGQDSILTIPITRGKITINPIPYYGYVAPGIGYINVQTFSEKTFPDFQNALAALRADTSNGPLKGLIIDLRDNGGGLLTSAVDLVSTFVPRSTEIVSTRGRDKMNSRTYKTTRNPVAADLPLVVLINSNTASAAEITAGSLQDLDRAVIIGERSYGKGLVQTPARLPYEATMKTTTGRYYLPSGRLIQAIDYRHRNADGSVDRIPDSLTVAYQTRGHREVRDGGGITPDINLERATASLLEYKLASDLWVFDFANKVANSMTSVPDAGTWELPDTLFPQFKAFIDPTRFKYDKPTETALDYLRKVARTEGYLTDSVASAIDGLASLMHRDLSRDMDYHRGDINDLLINELSQRWFSDSDIIRRSLKDDRNVNAAIGILDDPARYKALLAPGVKVGKKDDGKKDGSEGSDRDKSENPATDK